MGLLVNTRLSNGYSRDKLFDLIYSINELSDKNKMLVYCNMCVFIGMEDAHEQKIIEKNLDYIQKEILDVVQN